MKKIFTMMALGATIAAFGQSVWHPTAAPAERMKTEKAAHGYYTLDAAAMKAALANAGTTARKSTVTVELPTLSGKIEKFNVISLPVAEASLAAKYDLGSYAGNGLDDPGKHVRFSFSNGKLQAMIVKDGEYQFIDPANREQTVFGVYEKSDKTDNGKPFECSTMENVLSKQQIDKLYSENKLYSSDFTGRIITSDKKYRTLRLALSVTGEYTKFFGGTVQGALTAMNATMTRVNGVMERDLGIHLNMIDKPEIIYTDPATDPYSAASAGAGGAWNMELQKTLTSVVGDANYDIGHLFGASGGGGNAGCIGCICVNPTLDANGVATNKAKGSAYTSPADGKPFGDNFDIDYVAHEMGHQLGGNHTFSHNLESGTGANQEPGSGSTIMGYAGITGADNDVQPHSDAYYHYYSIEQIQKVVQKATCDVETDVSNNPPTLNPLLNYTIPKGTAFVLTASGYDPDGDALTYTWEQADNASVKINKTNLGTTTTGASFRSKPGTSNPTRYFPDFQTVMSGTLKSPATWEAVSSVARSSSFAVTARDNFYNGAQTQTSTTTVTVGADGPFAFTMAGSKLYTNAPQTITWDVANTDKAPYNVPLVNLDYTLDNGVTWTSINPSTANDGSELFSIPASAIGKTIKFRVTSIRNIFYAVSKGYLVQAQPTPCDGSAPVNLTVENVTPSSAYVSWDLVQGATYIVRYRAVGSNSWTEITTSTIFVTLTGLSDETNYEVQVAAVCSGTVGTFSNATAFATPTSVTYCAVTPPSSTYEYISNVTVNNQSFSSLGSGYIDYFNDPTKTISLKQGSTGNTISITKKMDGSEAVGAWIDFNRNGVFEASERVLSSPANQISPVTASFSVPTTVDITKSVKMRVILKYGSAIADTGACTSFSYGEIEDYKVVFTAGGGTLATVDAKGAKTEMQVFPNPAESVLNVSKASSKATYVIYSFDGKVAQQGALKNNQANVSSLVKGAYVIKVVDNGEEHSFKFIKK